MNEHLDWPMPLGYLPQDVGDGRSAETCLAAFQDGTSQIGTLERFLPQQGLVEIRSRGGDEPRLIILSQLKSLHMTRPLVPSIDGVDSLGARFHDRFEVEFFDGERLVGETCGFTADDRGLFLYLVNRSDTLTRFYAPDGAIKRFRMGDPQLEPGLPPPVKAPTAARSAVPLLGAASVSVARAPCPEPPATPAEPVEPADIATLEDLQQAMAALKRTPWLMLGDAVVREGLITTAQLQDALRRQQGGCNQPLGDILVDMGLVERGTINRLLARQFGIPFVDLRRFQAPEAEALGLLSGEICLRHGALPLAFFADGTLVLAMENPIDQESLQALSFFARRKLQPVMAGRRELDREIAAAYGTQPAVREGSGLELLEQLEADPPRQEAEDVQVTRSDSALVRLVNRVILDAVEQGASDIHIETYPDPLNTLVRLRKDGTLVPHLEIPAAHSSAFISRIKIMCQLDIAERRKPQDGKIEFRRFAPADVELRVATIPTANGLEDVVLRVLSAGKPIPLDQLGLSPSNLQGVTRMVARPHGLCLVCGPTGSGKTTTLHSVLNHVNVPGRKIWTAEDPIEITQPGLRQVQVNPRIGWTFAAAMRTFLRADPDIIMLGEIRDEETARVAIEGSLTGHFVYSTLHTNSAPESIVRLLDLGADPFNFADALLGVLAQRLAKRLCPACRAPRVATAEDMADLLAEYCGDSALDPAFVMRGWTDRFAGPDGRFTLHKARGCPRCHDSGYRGRIGLHELLVVSASTRRLIQTRATVAELVAVAMSEGMRTLKQDGIDKVLAGLTDMVQVRAMCG